MEQVERKQKSKQKRRVVKLEPKQSLLKNETLQ